MILRIGLRRYLAIERAVRYFPVPRFFSNSFYSCATWRGTRFCVSTKEQIEALANIDRAMKEATK